jgi:6-carboxyhexanoate--CoA ligase
MEQKALYSIRMHASANGRHVSGAERIVTSEHIDVVVRELVARAQGRPVSPDRITITIDDLAGLTIRMLPALDMVTMQAPDRDAGRSLASQVLQATGISSTAVEAAMHYIANGASSGGVLRGAMVMDSLTGERLEQDHERGVRASRFDWTDEALRKVQQILGSAGLFHHRTCEALALATKVAHAPGMVAELCWSDDPDYTAGYVASLRTGYVRFPFLKQRGDERGGRAFFVDRKRLNMDALVIYLQSEPVLINETGSCRSALCVEEIVGHSVKGLR